MFWVCLFTIIFHDASGDASFGSGMTEYSLERRASQHVESAIPLSGRGATYHRGQARRGHADYNAQPIKINSERRRTVSSSSPPHLIARRAYATVKITRPLPALAAQSFQNG